MARKLDRVPLAGSNLPPITNAVSARAGAIGPEVRVAIWLRRKPAATLPDPGAKGFTPISRTDYAKLHGAAVSDIRKVMNYLTSIDRRIVATEDNPHYPVQARRILGVKGPLKSLKEAFEAKVTTAQMPDGELVLMRTGELSLPKPLAGIVLGVFGLDTRPIGTRGRVGEQADVSSVDLSTLPTPPEIAARYEFPHVATCKNQVIALMQFGGAYNPDHPKQYFDDLQVRQPNLVKVDIAGGSTTPGTDYDKEVTLDIEVAGAVAEEATLVSYFAPHTELGWIEAISSAVHDVHNNPLIMSISWGAAELETSNTLTWTENGMEAMKDQFLDARYIDMTVLAACGDHGSDCRVGNGRAHVPYPASDPNVIACGGTSIANFGSNQEIAWERGGGGISDYFTTVPSYQNSVTLPLSRNTMGPGRGVPDIAGYAHPGYNFFIGTYMVLTGTSLVAPLYAAAFARMSAKAGGSPVGWYHDDLYSLSNLIRDVDNPQSNNTSNSFNGAPGYFGRKGWDGRTGLGIFKPGA